MTISTIGTTITMMTRTTFYSYLTCRLGKFPKVNSCELLEPNIYTVSQKKQDT